MSRQYQKNLDQALTQVMDEWWSNLSKSDILEFIADLEDVSADMLRDILKVANADIAFKQQFSIPQLSSCAIFNTGGETLGKNIDVK